MAIELVPIPLLGPADASKLANFGREVRGIDPATITLGSELLKEIESALYTVGLKTFARIFVLINFCIAWIAAWCASVSRYQTDACPAVCDHKGLCYLMPAVFSCTHGFFMLRRFSIPSVKNTATATRRLTRAGNRFSTGYFRQSPLCPRSSSSATVRYTTTRAFLKHV